MYKNYLKIFLIIMLIAIILLKYYKLNKSDNQIKLETPLSNLPDLELSDENDDSQENIDSDEIEAMFNMEKFDENNEKKESGGKQFAYLDIEYMNNRGRIVLNLNEDVVPKTTKNFIELCNKKAYVNSTFPLKFSLGLKVQVPLLLSISSPLFVER